MLGLDCDRGTLTGAFKSYLTLPLLSDVMQVIRIMDACLLFLKKKNIVKMTLSLDPKDY